MAGVGFSTHFCDGKVKDTEVFSFSKQSCCCGEFEEEGCCKDEIKIVKLEKDHLVNSHRNLSNQFSSSQFIPVSVFIFNFFESNSTLASIGENYSPPILRKKITILFCTFLI